MQRRCNFLKAKLAHFFVRPVSSILISSFCWILGLLLGFFFTAHAGDSYLLLMRRAAFSQVSISGLAAAVLLPFLFAAFAASVSAPRLICAVCFGKAFFTASCASGILAAYGDAGWLVRSLLQFSDIVSLPLLCWFSMRHVAANRQGIRRDLMICLIPSVIAVMIDFVVVSPFLAMLIEN